MSKKHIIHVLVHTAEEQMRIMQECDTQALNRQINQLMIAAEGSAEIAEKLAACIMHGQSKKLPYQTPVGMEWHECDISEHDAGMN